MAISNATRLANVVGAAITADGKAGTIAAQFIGNITGTAGSATAATNAYGLTGTPNIDVGIVTATSFFDSDGNIKGVGIATEGGLVGTGVTLLDFRNSGVSTVTVSSGIATLQITGGGGGGGLGVIEYFLS